MKTKKQDVLVLLAYSVTYDFLALASDTVLGYLPALLITGFLAWYCSREKKFSLVVVGNAVSAVLSFGLICFAFLGGYWSLELFGPLGWTFFLLALTIPVQAFCWNRYWGMLAAYLALLVGIVVYLYSQMLR